MLLPKQDNLSMKNLEMLPQSTEPAMARLRTRRIESPIQMKAASSLSEYGAATVERVRRDIQRILSGEDGERFVLLLGLCSIRDPEAALEYASRLSGLANAFANQLVVIMWVYFEKLRAVLGWKGLIYDEELSGMPASPSGLVRARELLPGISQMGFPVPLNFSIRSSLLISMTASPMDRLEPGRSRASVPLGNGRRN